jgi:RHS repeat-associated protein
MAVELVVGLVGALGVVFRKKERSDSSGLCYYGARYLAPWLTRWINPDSAGAVDGLNLYIYVGNNGR